MEEKITAQDRLFDVGTDPDQVPDDVDGPALLAEFQALHGRFLEHLDGMSAEDLAAKTEMQFPESPQTRLGALQFLLMHEGYHMGQLGALRVMTGKGSWMKRMQA